LRSGVILGQSPDFGDSRYGVLLLAHSVAGQPMRVVLLSNL